MRRRHRPFSQCFKNNMTIALPMSFIGSVGSIGMFPPPLASQVLLSLVSVIWSATVFSAVLGLAQSFVLPRLQFASFLLAVLATSATFFAVIAIAMPAGIVVAVSMASRVPPWRPEPWAVTLRVFNPLVLAGAFVLMVAITLGFMVSRKLGPGVLLNWMLGRYYRPRQEERVFMFIDLRDSTKLGEELGDLRFSRMIQMFFEDLSGPILETKGEVSHYIGDEAVVCWKAARGLKEANCLRCFFLCQDAIEAHREAYMSEFGTVPSFKAGAHFGSVVATQVGDIKSEIVYHGDVLNTTARIQGACNEVGADFLVSEALCQALNGETGYTFVDRGARSLKGKGQDVRVYSVERTV